MTRTIRIEQEIVEQSVFHRLSDIDFNQLLQDLIITPAHNAKMLKINILSGHPADKILQICLHTGWSRNPCTWIKKLSQPENIVFMFSYVPAVDMFAPGLAV